MKPFKKFLHNYSFIAFTLLFANLLTGCTALSIAGATAGAAVAVTGTAVKTTGAVVGAVIPDGDDKDDKD